MCLCITKRRKGETKEGGENEAGDREAHAGNRADPATQADAEHSGGSKSHTGAQTNRTREKGQPHTAQARKSKAPKDHPHKHQTEIHNSGTKPRNKDKITGAAPRQAAEALGKPRHQNPPSLGSKGANGPPTPRAKGQRKGRRAAETNLCYVFIHLNMQKHEHAAAAPVWLLLPPLCSASAWVAKSALFPACASRFPAFFPPPSFVSPLRPFVTHKHAET
jgi:hypothetical protein